MWLNKLKILLYFLRLNFIWNSNKTKIIINTFIIIKKNILHKIIINKILKKEI